MHIEILGEDTISTQARTYAEYRLFAALSQIVDTNRVTHARLVLRRTGDGPSCGRVSCTVAVDISGIDSLRIQASADHPYAAINLAVERLTAGSWPERVRMCQ